MLERIAYAAACVLVPLAWGLLVYRFSNSIEKAITALGGGKRTKSDTSDIFPDYHI
jgi:hypothetical protein